MLIFSPGNAKSSSQFAGFHIQNWDELPRLPLWFFSQNINLYQLLQYLHSPNPLLHKWRDEIFQKWLYGGGWEIFTVNGGKPRMGVGGFTMGDGKFLKSLYIVWVWVLTPYFMKTPLILPTFFKFFPPPPPISLSPPAPFRSPPLLFLLSFFLWVLNGDHITFHVLFYLIDLHMLSLGTLVQ